VDDAARRRVRQPGGHLDDVVERLGDGQPAAAFEDGAEVLALDELEGDEVQALILAAEEDAGDVLVVELGGAAGLLVEAADVLLVAGHLRGQDLQRDEAVELRVAGAEDGGHAADADGFDEFEVSELAAADAGVRLGGRDRGGGSVAGDDRGRVVGRRCGGGEDVVGRRADVGAARGGGGRGGVARLTAGLVGAVVVVGLHEPPLRRSVYGCMRRRCRPCRLRRTP